MRWRPEYDAVSQPGMIGRMGLCSETVQMPTWFVDYVVDHKLEDIDPKLTTRLLAGFCRTHHQGKP